MAHYISVGGCQCWTNSFLFLLCTHVTPSYLLFGHSAVPAVISLVAILELARCRSVFIVIYLLVKLTE